MLARSKEPGKSPIEEIVDSSAVPLKGVGGVIHYLAGVGHSGQPTAIGLEREGGLKEKVMLKQQAEFDKLLVDLCEYMISSAREGISFFELIDPLVSDTQCHIHAAFLHSMLSSICGGSFYLIPILIINEPNKKHCRVV